MPDCCYRPLNHDQEALFAELVQSANSIILRWDDEGRIIFMNRYGLDLFGFSEEELVGKNVIGTIVARTDSSGRDLAKMIDDILSHPEKYILNRNENICRDGSTLWIQWSNKAIVNRDGSLQEMLSIGIDMTPLRETEARLKNQQELYRSIFENAFDAHFLFQNRKYIAANHAGLKLLDCGFDELKGRTIGEFSPDILPDGTPMVTALDRFERALLTGEQVETDWQVKRKDGEIRQCVLRAQLVGRAEDQVVHVSLVDVTEQRIIQQEIRRRQKMEAIGNLAGGIAHDFNNILMAILGYTELMQMKLGTDSAVARELDQIKNASLRAKDLVSQILTFSRRGDQTMQAIHLGRVVREALQLLRPTIPTTIRIIDDIRSDRFIMADPTQIHQVIVNLCTNGRLAIGDKEGTLRIRLFDDEREEGRENGQKVILEVEDSGAGIDPAIIDRIFDPYFTTREHGRGSGLGLAVVHGIIRNHQAEISVDSHPGQGTCFRIRFPVAAGQQKSGSREADDISPAAGHCSETLNILLVDDELSLREVAGEFLREHGHNVVAKANGALALEEFKKNPHHWDLIITDQTMPEMTGIHLAEVVRSLRPDLPIILCTGYGQVVDQQRLNRMDLQAVMTKPISLHDLLREIRQTLSPRDQ